MARGNRNRPTARWGLSRNAAVAAGYRSSYEYAIAQQLTDLGIRFEYEAETFDLDVPATSVHFCPCGAQPRKRLKYTPDFLFNDRKFIVEAKGRFDPAHRIKAKRFVEMYPDIEYALLFESDNKLSPKSNTRYTTWCEKEGILCGVGLLPSAWLRELR
jgi:hypothetical protein